MKNSCFLPGRIPGWMTLILLLLFTVPTVTQAQEKNDRTPCLENLVGYVDGFIIFSCYVDDERNKICTIEKSTCECAAKEEFPDAKGCVDGDGKVIELDPVKNDEKEQKEIEEKGGEKTDTESTDTDDTAEAGRSYIPKPPRTPKVHHLAGETNCRLQTEFNKYLSIKKNVDGIFLDAKGNGQEARFDFRLAAPNNPSKGFYIVTREEKPRALIADGTKLSLRSIDDIDDKTMEKACWNIYVNGRNADGDTNYQLKLQNDSDNLLLGANPDKNKLEMVKDDGGSDATLAVKGDTDIVADGKSRNWKCDCSF